ncbi:hypothetical protein QTO34_008575 [Cnephaeus nilssonii]|uniref:DNA polymerase nu pseudo-exo domain-containing protein n=1 Tax=Cnephaeus nilssonii TaxID=3371016 RepID=A0AA40IAZ5_CNENI|nr:hypothetical protein QTO34_008575 [Eptesicus nilssonii]
MVQPSYELTRAAQKAGGPLAASAPGRVPEEGVRPSDRCIYIETAQPAVCSQEQEAHNQFARIFVRTVLQYFGDDGSWKHGTLPLMVADFVGLDPRIAAWLIDPSDATPSFEDLVAKSFGNTVTVTVSSTYGNSSRNTVNQNVCANLRVLSRLTMDLCSQLKASTV